jgi:hypothetical protein
MMERQAAGIILPLLLQLTQPAAEDVIKQEIAKSVGQQIARSVAQSGPFNPNWPSVLTSAVMPLLVTLGFFALVLMVVWLLVRKSQARTQARADFYRQVLDKFSSGREFAEFLEGKGSQRLLEDLWSERLNAKERILRRLGTGVVLTVLGLGILGLTWKNANLLYLAVLFLALGLGFLISTGVSYRLSKKWGLLREEEPYLESEPISQK